MAIEVVQATTAQLASEHVVWFELWRDVPDLLPGDFAACYIAAGGVTGPPGWTEIHGTDEGRRAVLFCKFLTGDEHAPRFTATEPIDEDRTYCAVFRGVDPI